ncbi:hypothetical protein BDZ45DRAFT_284028 [Acephala macrosclerotiorum]|nr:hypothetical protein BDZ45DRAFT_284028 [Acephala macrosclerotiorum]
MENKKINLVHSIRSEYTASQYDLRLKLTGYQAKLEYEASFFHRLRMRDRSDLSQRVLSISKNQGRTQPYERGVQFRTAIIAIFLASILASFAFPSTIHARLENVRKYRTERYQQRSFAHYVSRVMPCF